VGTSGKKVGEGCHDDRLGEVDEEHCGRRPSPGQIT
jgi:hypothetical protein